MLIDETGPVRYYSDECWSTEIHPACTGVANPEAPTKHKRGCHCTCHLPNF